MYLPIESTNRLVNPGKTPAELIQVQVGSYTDEDDIIRVQISTDDRDNSAYKGQWRRYIIDKLSHAISQIVHKRVEYLSRS